MRLPRPRTFSHMGRRFHGTFTVRDGAMPVGLGLRFFMWKPYRGFVDGPKEIYTIDFLFLVFCLQFGLCGRWKLRDKSDDDIHADSVTDR